MFSLVIVGVLTLGVSSAHARGNECWYPDNTGLDVDAVRKKDACSKGLGIAFEKMMGSKYVHEFLCVTDLTPGTHSWSEIQAHLPKEYRDLEKTQKMSIYQRDTDGMAFSYSKDCKDGRARTTDHRGGCQDFNLNGKNIPNHERLNFIHLGKAADQCLKNAEENNLKHGQPGPAVQSNNSGAIKNVGSNAGSTPGNIKKSSGAKTRGVDDN